MIRAVRSELYKACTAATAGDLPVVVHHPNEPLRQLPAIVVRNPVSYRLRRTFDGAPAGGEWVVSLVAGSQAGEVEATDVLDTLIESTAEAIERHDSHRVWRTAVVADVTNWRLADLAGASSDDEAGVEALSVDLVVVIRPHLPKGTTT